jgi:cyclic-di-GMP-binding biofilm dispersal mediator protein
MPEFHSKKALVIGGSRGIGAAIVARLAAGGADVTFTYASSGDSARALVETTGATGVHSDAGDRDELIATVTRCGALDILVVNAGISVGGDPLSIARDAIDRMIDVNLRAPYFAAVEAGRRMNDHGRIIVIGSAIASRVPDTGGTAYAMTKSAMHGMVRGLAREFGGRSITVNLVAPGPVDTGMNPAAGADVARIHKFMAIKRHGRADEIADLVAYLARRGSGFITGAIHSIDGGYAA